MESTVGKINNPVRAFPDYHNDLIIIVGTTTVEGTAGNDNLVGTSGINYIYGYAGADTLDGLGGNDFLDGGDRNDILIDIDISIVSIH